MFTSSVCVLKLKVQFCTQRKWFEECAEFSISCGRGQCVFVASPRRLCRKFVLQNVGGTEWVRSKKLFGGVGMCCMNLVTCTVISKYTLVPVTLTIL